MKYEELQALARAMSPEEAEATLRQLANDRRFAAVIRLVTEQKELASDSSSALQFANSHGCLAHAAGVRYGMLELEGRFRALCTPKKKKAEPPSAAD